MSITSSKLKFAVLGGVAALTMTAGLVAAPASAEAGWRGHRVGYYGGYPPYFGGHPHFYRGWGGGGAPAAGLVGGLGLCGVAAKS